MDSIIYDYLINNENNIIDDQQGVDNDNQVFLDCLLMLSINKINIDYNTLLHYCNNIIKNSNNINICNNKRNLNLEYDQNQDQDIHYRLDNNQFNVLYKVIKSLNNVVQHVDDNNSSRIQTLIDQHPNNKDSKFDCSIIIIIKNNLKLLQQQHNNNSSGSNINNNMFKRIKLNNNTKSSSSQQQQCYQQQQQARITRNLGCSCSCRCISGSSGSGVDYNYLLFKKVWGNIVIRNEIKFHLRLFNLHRDEITVNYKEFMDYKYRNYLRRVLYFDTGYKFTVEQHSKYISSNVKHLNISYHNLIEENSIPSTVNTLILGGGLNQKLTNQMFNNIGGIGGDNITSLEFGDCFNQSLNDDSGMGEAWLPRNLTSLQFGKSFQQNITPGQLPNSLTSLVFHQEYKGRILPNSIPKSVTTLNYTFNSYRNSIALRRSPIPKSITNLKFDDDFNQMIEIGAIPHNVTSLTFGVSFNSTIKAGSLPKSIISLEFGSNFNQPINGSTSILPCNLTSLIFGLGFNQPILNGANNNGQSCLPISITKLHLGTFTSEPIYNSFSYLSNLKELKIGDTASSELGILPDSIRSLDLGDHSYQYPLTSSILSSPITSLSYYHDNYSIPRNHSLPNSITSLELLNDVNDKTDIPNPLPSNLKSITLSMHDSHLDLSSIDWWPTSLETIYVRNHNITLFNRLPTDFFLKYFKTKK